MKRGDKYSIGEVEEICNIPRKTLRYYDSIKLVVPKFRDEETKYRYYSKDQMVTLCIIRKLKMFGFTLEQIQHIVNDNKTETLKESIECKLLEIHNEINNLQKIYSDAYAFWERLKEGVDIISYCAEENTSAENIRIEEIPEMYLLFTRKLMKKYSNSEVSLERWIEIISLCNKMQLKSKGLIVVTYDSDPLDQFFFKDVMVEFGMSIESPANCNSNNCRKFGGFTAVTTTHIGDYSNIMNTHIKMIQWINKNGYKIAGNISEEFIISPLDVNNVDEHITKVIIPVTKI
ncbi:Multidrug-efflux transporter 1 regulator [Clostridium liquoris]|jgi:DNA-binding transcriptional MerR regulator|uniref:Multidrug-efflux transporter 1 regulator n=1 Tax=Clostridium liquoris TaxID=1289519 RepID=A0A2T0B5J7_9CLOT|nr:MerR family transcriptional regulator [Clostridium liquoris]PRR79164.1 Multidrug-efflux transporter 1 regulator [Clostridium liquoris]